MSDEMRVKRPYDDVDAESIEKARCLAIATDVLTRGPGFPCCPEFADGYSNAAQQIAAEIEGGAVPITGTVRLAVPGAEFARSPMGTPQQLCNMGDGLLTQAFHPHALAMIWPEPSHDVNVQALPKEPKS